MEGASLKVTTKNPQSLVKRSFAEDEIPPLRTFAGFSILSFLLAVSVYYVAKKLVIQERPNQEDNHAFPSGHTFYMTLAASLWTFYTFSSRIKKKETTICYYSIAGFAWSAVFSVALLSVFSHAQYVGDTVASVCFVLTTFLIVLNFYCPKSEQSPSLNRLTELFVAVNLAISNPKINFAITFALMIVLFLTNLINNYCDRQQAGETAMRIILEAIPLPKWPLQSSRFSQKELIVRAATFSAALAMGAINIVALVKGLCIPFAAVSGYNTSTERALGKQEYLLSSENLDDIRTALVVILGSFSFFAWILQSCYSLYSGKELFSREIAISPKYQDYQAIFSSTFLGKKLSTIYSVSECTSQSSRKGGGGGKKEEEIGKDESLNYGDSLPSLD